MKTIHGGTAHYTSPIAREEQSGAVRHREHRVQPDYERHARALDRRFFPDQGTPGPILTRLLSLGTIRGLVFGHYGEASADVHTLLTLAARQLAQRRWQLAGARSADEMYGFLVGQLRRRLGLAIVQANARYRLGRLQYIGVPRQSVVALMQQAQYRARAAQHHHGPVPSFVDFYGFQALALPQRAAAA